MKVFGMVYSVTNKKVKLFNTKFVKYYKNHFKIIYENKIYPIKSDFIIHDNNINKLNIKLISFGNIPDNAFEGCKSLLLFYKINMNRPNSTGYKDIIKTGFQISKMIYKIDPKKNKIKLFGKEFVKRNMDKCKIIYNNNIFPFKEYFYIEDLEKKSKDKLELYLIEKENIPDKSYMFHNCKLLEEFSIINDNNDVFNNIIKNINQNRNIEKNNPSEFFETFLVNFINMNKYLIFGHSFSTEITEFEPETSEFKQKTSQKNNTNFTLSLDESLMNKNVKTFITINNTEELLQLSLLSRNQSLTRDNNDLLYIIVCLVDVHPY